ncbi:hypothetical protein Ancab_023416 [Ancistrocladus abbreviatus]
MGTLAPMAILVERVVMPKIQKIQILVEILMTRMAKKVALGTVVKKEDEIVEEKNARPPFLPFGLCGGGCTHLKGITGIGFSSSTIHDMDVEISDDFGQARSDARDFSGCGRNYDSDGGGGSGRDGGEDKRVDCGEETWSSTIFADQSTFSTLPQFRLTTRSSQPTGNDLDCPTPIMVDNIRGLPLLRRFGTSCSGGGGGTHLKGMAGIGFSSSAIWDRNIGGTHLKGMAGIGFSSSAIWDRDIGIDGDFGRDGGDAKDFDSCGRNCDGDGERGGAWDDGEERRRDCGEETWSSSIFVD